MSCVFVADLSDLRISQGVPMSDPLLTAGRPKNCLPYPCPCLEVSLPLSCCFISCVNIIVVVDQVASPWDRAVARARFGTPPPKGEETEMDIEGGVCDQVHQRALVPSQARVKYWSKCHAKHATQY